MSVFAAYRRYVPSRVTVTSASCRSLSRWCESVEFGMSSAGLNVADDHAVGMGGQQQAEDPEPGFGPQRRKHLGVPKDVLRFWSGPRLAASHDSPPSMS